MAQSKEELSIMYQKLNYLQSTLTPNYSAAGYMRGNIHQLTIGGYFYETPGVITSLNYTMPENSTWEIGINDEGSFDPTVKELTHRIEVQVNFKPIHRFIPETIQPNELFSAGNIKQRFISLANKSDAGLYANGIPNNRKLPSILPSVPAPENGISLEAKPIGDLNLQQPTTEGLIQRQSIIPSLNTNTTNTTNRRRRNNQ